MSSTSTRLDQEEWWKKPMSEWPETTWFKWKQKHFHQIRQVTMKHRGDGIWFSGLGVWPGSILDLECWNSTNQKQTLFWTRFSENLHMHSQSCDPYQHTPAFQTRLIYNDTSTTSTSSTVINHNVEPVDQTILISRSVQIRWSIKADDDNDENEKIQYCRKEQISLDLLSKGPLNFQVKPILCESNAKLIGCELVCKEENEYFFIQTRSHNSGFFLSMGTIMNKND